MNREDVELSPWRHCGGDYREVIVCRELTLSRKFYDPDKYKITMRFSKDERQYLLDVYDYANDYGKMFWCDSFVDLLNKAEEEIEEDKTKWRDLFIESEGSVGKSAASNSNSPRGWSNFPSQSPVCGGDDGLPRELDSITFPRWRTESVKAYGNAIVPEVARRIFECIDQLSED